MSNLQQPAGRVGGSGFGQLHHAAPRAADAQPHS